MSSSLDSYSPSAYTEEESQNRINTVTQILDQQTGRGWKVGVLLTIVSFFIIVILLFMAQ